MKKVIKVWFLTALCLVWGVCLLVACTNNQESVDTSAHTVAESLADTEASTQVQEVTNLTETLAEAQTDAETQEQTDTEASTAKAWEQDTGKFNDGIVDYQKEVVTEIIEI